MDDEQGYAWTVDQLASLPGNMVMDIVVVEYQRGNVGKALNLLSVADKANAKGGFGSRSRLKDLLVSKGDMETLSALSDIAPNWFSEKDVKDSGGVALAVVAQNMPLLKMLIASGAAIDGISLGEVKKYLPGWNQKSSFPVNSEYVALPALYWACVMGNLEAVRCLLESGKGQPLVHYESIHNLRSNRSGKRVSADIWAETCLLGHTQILRLLFDHPSYKGDLIESMSNYTCEKGYGRRSFQQGLAMLLPQQQEVVWETMEKDISSAWFSGGKELRTSLLKDFPQRYVKYLNELGTSPPRQEGRVYSWKEDVSEVVRESFFEDWKMSIRMGQLDVAMALSEQAPEWMLKTWQDLPAGNGRIKRQQGPLSLAIEYVQEGIVDWLLEQPGVFENEKKGLLEYFSKRWWALNAMTNGRFSPSRVDAQETAEKAMALGQKVLILESVQKPKAIAANESRMKRRM